MTAQQIPPLFQTHPRAEKIAKAASNADEAAPGWRDRAAAFVLAFGKTRATFTAEDATKAFGEDQPTQGAMGAVFVTLAKQRKIEKTGEYRARAQGNAQPVWKLTGEQP